MTIKRQSYRICQGLPIKLEVSYHKSKGIGGFVESGFMNHKPRNIVSKEVSLKKVSIGQLPPQVYACVLAGLLYNSEMVSLNESLAAFRERFLQSFPWRAGLFIIVAALVLAWMLYAPEGILGKADAVGYAVCHRIGDRSFHIGDYQFSVCARCTGQYLGAVLGMGFLTIFRKGRSGRPPWLIIGILGLWAVGYAVDGVNSALHLLPWTENLWLYEPDNILRLITGTGVGLALSVMLFPAFNQTLWKRSDPRPVLEGRRDFGLLLVLAVMLILLVLTENPIILYPLSLISAGGVLMLLTMVYTMVWVMVFRAENHFENIYQIFFPLLAGFAVALTQILALDIFRFWLTGTWGGFPFD